MTTLRPDLPENYVKEAMELDAQAVISLFQLDMTPPAPNPPVTLRLNDKRDIMWQGVIWEGYSVNLTGELIDSSGEVGRPKFSLANLDGLFSTYVHQRWLDNAVVTRYRVLREDIDADINSYVRNTWRVSKVLTLSKTLVTMELRGVLDSQFFTIPARRFQPPEFPHVSLT